MSHKLLERIDKQTFINMVEKSNSFSQLSNYTNAGYRYILAALAELNLLNYFKEKIQKYKKQNTKIIFQNNLKFKYYDKEKHCYKVDAKKWCELFFNNQIIYNNAVAIKKYIIEAGYKINKCQICGITQWNGKPIICQLHHIDGNKNNNKLQNLQMLCPNCHTQTNNYGSKNAAKKQKK